MYKIKSIALIYDNASHLMNIGESCRRALETMCSVTYYHPADIDNIPERAYDLYLNIDDSLRYILPVYLKPSVWWVIDNGRQFEWVLEKGRLFDIVFNAEKDYIERFEKEGIKKVRWLPLCSQPDLQKYQEIMKMLLDKAEGVLSDIYTGGTRGYYHTPRPELFDMISPDVKHVLEVGCGAGLLGENIKRKHNANVTGIELVKEAADEAGHRLDRVINGDCEELNFQKIFKGESFDCLILGDVLEHLRNPQQFLKKIRPFLKNNADIIASIPNIQNILILNDLVKGNWTYMDYGILDKTHLRFFTRKEIQKMFVSAGYGIDKIQERFDSSYHRWVNQGKPAHIKTDFLSCGPLPIEDVKDFFVYQYLVKAVTDKSRFMVSIVILTFNALDLIKQCVDSIIKYSDIPYELVIVDNGSGDDVLLYLDKLKEDLTDRMKLIKNSTNRGFPYGCNQGIKASSGEYIVLLNSDTIVTNEWLSGMYSVFVKNPDVGIVGPLTNNTAPGEQMIPKEYSNIAELDMFAKNLKERNNGMNKIIQYPDYLTGFCMMIKKVLINNIGLFDNDFGIGTFEDIDYCWRAGLHGYKTAIAQDVFIHHRLMGSFSDNKIDINEISNSNLEIFRQKQKINNYREVEIKMDSMSTCNGPDRIEINYIAITSIRFMNQKGYQLDLNFSINNQQEETIRFDFTNVNNDDLTEIAGGLLSVSLRSSGYGDKPELIRLCKEAVQNTIELKLIKLPRPEKVVFLMNKDRKPAEILC